MNLFLLYYVIYRIYYQDFLFYIVNVRLNQKIENENIRAKSQSELSSVKLDNPNKKFYMKLIIVAILDYISRSSTWISYAITKVESKK